ncbi:MAG: tetratricopeptide repeat protein [Cyanobacteria bacterium SZAS LIN-3]|nr:tetratricopeptide repeat protein [Cyanobacteria bacterium SZAS LIN-3]
MPGFPTAAAIAAAITLAILPTVSLADTTSEAEKHYHWAYKEFKTPAKRTDALNEINLALALNPREGRYWSLKGTILLIQEDNELALPCFEKALQYEPKSADSWEAKAAALAGLHRDKEALAAVNKAIALKDEPRFRTTHSEILCHLNRAPEAERELDQLIQKYPADEIFRGRRAKIATTTGHWQKVVEDLNVVLKARTMGNMTTESLLAMRAKAYVNLKQYDKARADYTMGLKAGPSYRPFHEGLLQLCKLTGDEMGAKKEAAALRNLDNEFEPFK